MAELTGSAAASRIVLAAPIALAEIEARFAGQIEDRDAVSFDAGSASLRARRTRRLGAIALSEQIKPVTPNAETAQLLAAGIATLGIGKLPWSKAQLQLRNRVSFLRRSEGDEWPDLSDSALAQSALEWLAPFLTDKTALSQIGADDLAAALDALLPWNLRKRLDAEAPTHFTAPTGSAVPIDYEAEQGPTVSIRVQELFGLATHPTIAGGRVPLVIELLVARASSGAGHARPAGLLARQLCRRENRDARALSQASLAGRSALGARHPPRQAARAIARIRAIGLTGCSPSRRCRPRR